MKISKKKIASFGSGVLALAMVVGSWAYFSSTSKITNEFNTEKFGGQTVEEFTPQVPLEPGKEVDKVVGVENTGDYDLVVRIKMDETWKLNDGTELKFESADDAFNSVVRTGTLGDYAYDAKQANEPAGTTDGLTAGDESIIYKTLDLTNWVDGGDGYWYYKNNLTPGALTGALLTSVVMADDADIGRYDVTEFYSTADKATVAAAVTAYNGVVNTPGVTTAQIQAAQATLDAVYAWTKVSDKPTDFDDKTINFKKSESKLSSDAGYANADYALVITTEICQATADAVNATWNAGAAFTAPAGTSWDLK